MFKTVELSNPEILNLSNALDLIQQAEMNTMSEDGSKILKVNALPPKTANRIRNQKSEIKSFVEDYQETIKSSVEKANEAAKLDDEERTAQEIFVSIVEELNNETYEVNILKNSLKYSDDSNKSDFGGLLLKSAILEIVPEGFIEYVE